MCRYINAEQIIGATFIQLLIKEKSQLSFSELFKISKDLDIETRRNNNAVIRMSTSEIYNTVNNYGAFFCIEDDSIKLSDTGRERYNNSFDEFIDILDSYFYAGIPGDIKKTVIKTILKVGV